MNTIATLQGTTRALFPPLQDSSTRTATAEPEPKDQAISNEATPDPKNLVKTGQKLLCSLGRSSYYYYYKCSMLVMEYE